jgi:hypothetical protein
MSKYFTHEEMKSSVKAAQHGIDNSIPAFILPTCEVTATQMDMVREFLGHPVIVDSWYRCPALNTLVGSKPTSQHTVGEAVDFVCPQFGSAFLIAKALVDSGIFYDQLILEHQWVHISFKSNPHQTNRKQVLSLLSSGGYAYGLTNIHGDSLV